MALIMTLRACDNEEHSFIPNHTCSFAAMTACHAPNAEQVKQQGLLDSDLAKYIFSKEAEFLSRETGRVGMSMKVKK